METTHTDAGDADDHHGQDHQNETKYEGDSTAITVTSSALTTKRPPAPSFAERSDESEMRSEATSESESKDRPKSWKKARHERQPAKGKKAWSKTKAKKIKKQKKREQKAKHKR